LKLLFKLKQQELRTYSEKLPIASPMILNVQETFLQSFIPIPGPTMEIMADISVI